ncbi:metal ABC transporter permease [Corynebacterium poyangense]|uniref:Metal ABC transporter permease n=1 Tax=Corynebacterium poyangense TaxID=2684405 RepID=A0A7H0SMC6_9CORY|nr:metal ABC transporter permease [Corynebacterium poyangense]MBZ8176802.1 metal ABC transporter permease [Corynebacterium poyangense]QNQ89701.1 metal ABC transporter permease [Corynebacterium poyangense]
MVNILVLPVLEITVVGVLSGLVGVFAVLNRRVFFSESITHGTFPGAVLGVVVGNTFFELGHHGLSLTLMIGALAMCVPLSWLMHRLAIVPGISAQSAAGTVLTLGFALGYFLSTWFKPLPLKIENFLAGSLLNANLMDLGVASAVLSGAVLVVAVHGKFLIFHCFDPGGFRAAGHRSARAESMILSLICLTSVAVIPAVGTILSIALLVAPAAGLLPLCASARMLLITAPLAGAGIGVSGLALAVVMDLSAGGTIAVIAGIFYLFCLLLAKRQRN